MCLADVGEVLALDGSAGTAEVRLDGRIRAVSLAPLVLDGREVEVGDWIVVHTGLAVEVLDPAEAAEVIEVRAEVLGEDPREVDARDARPRDVRQE